MSPKLKREERKIPNIFKNQEKIVGDDIYRIQRRDEDNTAEMKESAFPATGSSRCTIIKCIENRTH